VSLALRWTEQATQQLEAIAEYISVSSPVYAEQVVERIVARLRICRRTCRADNMWRPSN
jgi:plasmid stabilization system protein ParE